MTVAYCRDQNSSINGADERPKGGNRRPLSKGTDVVEMTISEIATGTLWEEM